MELSVKVQYIIERIFNGEFIDREAIEYLLRVPGHTIDAGFIISAADQINREASANTAEIHAQIGLNLSPCPVNCAFCAFAARNKVFSERKELSVKEAVHMAMTAEHEGANALFIMATGDYPFAKFIEIAQEIKSHMSNQMVLIANIGDFTIKEAKKLKNAGFTGVYHAIRMGEGEVTRIDPDIRRKTINAAREEGLLIGTCVEPVGPEHTVEEIAEKILLGRQMNPCFSGAMRRINIPGSSLEKYGMLSEYQLGYLVAVTRLAMGRNLKCNCTHEPNVLGAVMGANLFWAEVGSNPRDTVEETSNNRGIDVQYCKKLLEEAEYRLLEGPSVAYRKDNVL